MWSNDRIRCLFGNEKHVFNTRKEMLEITLKCYYSALISALIFLLVRSSLPVNLRILSLFFPEMCRRVMRTGSSHKCCISSNCKLETQSERQTTTSLGLLSGGELERVVWAGCGGDCGGGYGAGCRCLTGAGCVSGW